MDQTTYNKITSYIKDVCGITLSADKEYLIVQRLTPVMNNLNIPTFEELAVRLSTKFDSYIREQIIIAITTNETSFFRDSHPYQLLENKIIPGLIELARERKVRSFQRRGAKISIWSAACSTGQEPYSIAIKIKEYLANHFITDITSEDFAILATDISSKVLAKAVRGAYSDSDLRRGLSPTDISRHFVKEGAEWVAREELRKLIDFKSINLTEPFTQLGSFDLIFCRNVLIYFDEQLKQKILNQMCDMLNSGGHLVLGAAESMYGLNNRFEQLNHNGSHYFRKG